MVGCESVVTNSADELCANSWSAVLSNDNEISLCFDGDNATLKVNLADKQSASISGLCEISDSAFVIHDEKTNFDFAFSYIVHFNRVQLVYGENTVSLYKM